MIDTKKLRRLGEGQQWIGRWYDAGCETLMAERDGEHEEVAHPMPIGLVPYLVAVQPAAISELLDRLEAAESARRDDYQNWMTALDRNAALLAKLEAAEKERDALRAKVSEMEQQELGFRERCAPSAPTGYSNRFPLYALPGAKGEEK